MRKLFLAYKSYEENFQRILWPSYAKPKSSKILFDFLKFPDYPHLTLNQAFHGFLWNFIELVTNSRYMNDNKKFILFWKRQKYPTRVILIQKYCNKIILIIKAFISICSLMFVHSGKNFTKDQHHLKNSVHFNNCNIFLISINAIC